jgi:hypothetical protein
MASAVEPDDCSWSFRDEVAARGHVSEGGEGESARGNVGAGTGVAAAAGESTSSQPTHGDDGESAGGGAKFSDDGSQVLQRDVSSAAAPRQPLASQDLALQVSTPIHTPQTIAADRGQPKQDLAMHCIHNELLV